MIEMSHPKFAISTMIGVCICILISCTTISPYHPSDKVGDTGYSETKFDDTHFRVSFDGNSSTTRHEVEDYLLFRSAEITLDNGYDYFVVSEQDTEVHIDYMTEYQGPAYYGRFVHLYPDQYIGFPYYAYGFDWSHPYRSDVKEIRKYSAIAYITLFKGNVPADQPKALDAQAIIESLGPIPCWDKEDHDKKKCRLDHG